MVPVSLPPTCLKERDHDIGTNRTGAIQLQIIEPVAADVARTFYARLFEFDPSLRAMFLGDMEEQGRKLTHRAKG